MSKEDYEFQTGGGFTRIKFECGSREKSAANAINSASIFVIDNSGSMSSDYKEVLAAVTYMMSRELELPKFIVYNSQAEIMTAEQVLKTKSTGMTSFVNAFKKIQEQILALPVNSSVQVVFFTDGRETVANCIRDGFELFTTFIRNCRRQVVIHSLGFTADHDKAFLEKLTKCGTTPGMYRYANKSTLNERFEELFEFLQASRDIDIRIGEEKFTIRADSNGYGSWTVDVVVPREFNAEELRITVEDREIILYCKPQNAMFQLMCVDQMQIDDQPSLMKVQSILNEIQIFKAPRQERNSLMEFHSQVQQKLDKYHELFANVSRSQLQGGIGAELNSLRFEANFRKARRQRTMHKRAFGNADLMSDIEKKLRSLKPNLEAFKCSDHQCILTGDTIYEIMGNTENDFLVFGLRVCRPEEAVDAPTELRIEDCFVGEYSNSGFTAALRWALNQKESNAHGGFCPGFKSLGGIFKGMDGKYPNACLPLFINKDHFERVHAQLPAILGYFFTLDPLGYKGDQKIALYNILGNLLMLRSNGKFTGQYANFIVDEMTKFCAHLYSDVMGYLRKGLFGGEVRGDLFKDFLDSPAYRSKKKINNLLTILGWRQANAGDSDDDKRFYVAFVEELWRRSLGELFKNHNPQVPIDYLQKLILSKSCEEQTEEEAHIRSNKEGYEKRFSEWAMYKLGNFSKKKEQEMKMRFGEEGPGFETRLEEVYVPRPMVDYEEEKERLDGVVNDLLTRIEARSKLFDVVLHGHAMGVGFTDFEKYLMMLQAVTYASSKKMNSACEAGHYVNTFDIISKRVGVEKLTNPLYEKFDKEFKECWDQLQRHKTNIYIAKRICVASNMSFVGRLMVKCPTRGGPVFDNVVSLLREGSVDGYVIPGLEKKIRAILVGKLNTKQNIEYPVISNGLAWALCPKDVASDFRDRVGLEEFAQMEITMYSTVGWVYRESDIPNRHGHCNSNPNPSLVTRFDGFHLPS